MRQARPIFDRYEVNAIVKGKKVVSATRLKQLLAMCLQRIDELQATVDEYEETEAEYEFDHIELIPEGYINDKD